MGMKKISTLSSVLGATILIGFSSLALGGADETYERGLKAYQGDPAQARALFVLAAEQGNVSAMVGAGRCFEAEKDFAKAIEWYEKAVAENSIKACEGLARVYASCPDPAFHDGANAVKYAAAVARKNPRDAETLALLAAAHARNFDFSEAVRIQKTAVQYGSMERSKEFKRRVDAFKAGAPEPAVATDVWILGAADAGSTWGMREEGARCHKRGDLVLATAWFEKAMKAGSVEAALALGDAFHRGVGADLNWIRAAACFSLVRDGGGELGETRARWLNAFEPIYEKLEGESAEACFEEGTRREKWVDEILARASRIPEAREKSVAIRASLLQGVLFYFAIADAKGEPRAAAEFERVQKSIEASTRTLGPEKSG